MSCTDFIQQYAMCDWKYVGDKHGYGERHLIMWMSAHEVVTIAKTHAWLGTAKQFLLEFQPL